MGWFHSALLTVEEPYERHGYVIQLSNAALKWLHLEKGGGFFDLESDFFEASSSAGRDGINPIALFYQPARGYFNELCLCSS
jgi:hypothetical protein